MPNKKIVKKNIVFFLNNQAVTLLELIVIVAVLAVITIVAVTKINSSVKKTFLMEERALLIALSKAAINYNTQYDSWYGQTLSQDIFSGLLDNPPPHQIFNNDYLTWSEWSTNRHTWKINFTPGPPASWLIGCPHHYGFFATSGSSWYFYAEGGKIKPYYGGYPGANFHKWP